MSSGPPAGYYSPLDVYGYMLHNATSSTNAAQRQQPDTQQTPDPRADSAIGSSNFAGRESPPPYADSSDGHPDSELERLPSYFESRADYTERLPHYFSSQSNALVSTQQPVYRCRKCGKSGPRLGSREELETHLAEVHNRELLQLVDCEQPDCPRRGDNGFRKKKNMLEHMRNVHNVKTPKRLGILNLR